MPNNRSDNFYLLSDKIRFSAFNDYDINSYIPEFCSQLKNKSLKKLKNFINNSTSNTDALRIIVKEIINQPLYLLEALQQYPDTLTENEKYFLRQKWINDKMQFVKDKFTGYKNKLESEIRELAATDPEKLKKLLKAVFLFAEQFISDLKQYQSEFKYLYSPLFKLYLNEIIYFKSYYLAEFGEFHFPEINAIEIKVNSEQQITSNPTPATNTKDEKSEKKPEYSKLIEAFETTSKYHKVMKLLADNGYCEQVTFVWKEDKANKAILIFLLKDLHKKSYYKDNRKLKNSEIKNIALNTFGVDVSISYVKQSETGDKDLKKLIPFASTCI